MKRLSTFEGIVNGIQLEINVKYREGKNFFYLASHGVLNLLPFIHLLASAISFMTKGDARSLK